MIYSGLQFILKLIPRRISAQKKIIHTDMEVFCNIDQDFYRAIGASPFKIAEVAMGNTKFSASFSCDNFAFVRKVKIRLPIAFGSKLMCDLQIFDKA